MKIRDLKLTNMKNLKKYKTLFINSCIANLISIIILIIILIIMKKFIL